MFDRSPAPKSLSKLPVRRAESSLEKQADRVADHVLRVPDRHHTSPSGAQGGSATQSAAPVNPGGQPLDASLRSYFEPRFGFDFSKVRVHADEEAAQSARSLGALAYTAGTQIAFGRGQYQPASAEGRRLLAHELAHVAQQGGAQPQPETRSPYSALSVVGLRPQIRPAIQRKPDPDADSHVPQSGVDRMVMNWTDAQLYEALKDASPGDRYAVWADATGAFKARVQAMLTKYNLEAVRMGVTRVEHVRPKQRRAPSARPSATASASASAPASPSAADRAYGAPGRSGSGDSEASFMAWMLAPGMIPPPKTLRDAPEGIKEQYGYDYQSQIVTGGANVAEKIADYGSMAADFELSIGTAGISPTRAFIGTTNDIADTAVKMNAEMLLKNLNLPETALTILGNREGVLVYEARTGVLRIVGHGFITESGAVTHAGLDVAKMAAVIRKFPKPVKAIELQGCNLGATQFPDLLAKDIGIAVKSYTPIISNVPKPSPGLPGSVVGMIGNRDAANNMILETVGTATSRWSHP